MSLSKLPLTDSFALAWEFDPAFDRIDPEDPDGKPRKTWEHDWEVACDRLDWAPLCIPGRAPSLFRFRIISGKPLRTLLDAQLGTLTSFAYAFRMMIAGVENFDGFPDLKRRRDADHPELGDMAQPDLVDFLDRISLAVGAPQSHLVTNLGSRALQRCVGVSPK